MGNSLSTQYLSLTKVDYSRVIAVLFGRFGLSVSTAMEEYLVLAEKVFAFPLDNGTYEEAKLREVVQDLCEKYLGDRDALLLDEADTKKPKT